MQGAIEIEDAVTNQLAASPRISNQKSENIISPNSYEENDIGDENKKDDPKKLKLKHTESYPTTVYAFTENLFEGSGGISPDRSPTNKQRNERFGKHL